MRPRIVVPLLAAGLVLAAAPAAGAQQGTGSVAGTVTATNGTPLAGVCVDVFGMETGESVVTGADGRYVADGLPAGDYLVVYNLCEEPLEGYAGEFWDDAAGFEEATPVLLEAGDDVTGINAALAPGAVLSGTITDEESGDPLGDVCVSAYTESSGSYGQTRSEDDGTYAITTLRGGEYVVFFSDCGAPFTHLPEAYDDVAVDGAEPSEPTRVTLAESGSATGIDAALEEGGSVAGTVTGLHTGEPVNGLCVGLLPPDGGQFPTFPGTGYTGFLPDGTAAPGEYVIPSVRPGEYVLGFNPFEVCGDDGYTAQWYDEAVNPADAETVVVEAGDVLERYDAVVAPRPSISLACNTFGPPTPPGFTDVPDGNLHATAIDCIAQRGLTSGRGDGTFGPIEEVRRDQLASFVARTLTELGVELPRSPRDAFRDDEDSVHERAINQLAALGIVAGTDRGRYSPLETVTRGQMATFLVRTYEEATGYELRSPDDVFTDDDGYIHEGNIDRAATAGLAVGRTTTLFRPLELVNREQMATFLARLLDRVQRDRPLDLSGPGILFGGGDSAAPAPFSREAAAAVLTSRTR